MSSEFPSANQLDSKNIAQFRRNDGGRWYTLSSPAETSWPMEKAFIRGKTMNCRKCGSWNLQRSRKWGWLPLLVHVMFHSPAVRIAVDCLEFRSG